MAEKVKVVDGVLVTNTEVLPPRLWTNEYEKIGGDSVWAEDGKMFDVMSANNIFDEIKPLFGTTSSNEDMSWVLFQISDIAFYLYSQSDDTLFRVQNPITLEEIVSTIDDQGLEELRLEDPRQVAARATATALAAAPVQCHPAHSSDEFVTVTGPWTSDAKSNTVISLQGEDTTKFTFSEAVNARRFATLFIEGSLVLDDIDRKYRNGLGATVVSDTVH